VIHYRTFRNADPPGLAAVWNASFTGRGGAVLPGPALLEYFFFAKPYFDPEGLVVACADGQVTGFALAGFGCDPTGHALNIEVGVTCLIGVLPDYRRQGIGSELLRRCETYLRGRGARELAAGPLAPLDPFTFGLYGGSRPAGFLDSDSLARLFFEHHGYAVRDTRLVWQRQLDRPLVLADARFAAHRQRYELDSGPAHGLTWWQECVLGPVELLEYRLRDRTTGLAAARATVWEMETYSERWNQQAIGIVDLEVVPELRRRGLARFLLAQLIRDVREQFFQPVEVVETHTDPGNAAGLGLLRSLGFEQADAGYSYRRPAENPVADRG
jgi:ribosomal protein S18 acetylase RimI-like enzyme